MHCPRRVSCASLDGEFADDWLTRFSVRRLLILDRWFSAGWAPGGDAESQKQILRFAYPTAWGPKLLLSGGHGFWWFVLSSRLIVERCQLMVERRPLIVFFIVG